MRAQFPQVACAAVGMLIGYGVYQWTRPAVVDAEPKPVERIAPADHTAPSSVSPPTGEDPDLREDRLDLFVRHVLVLG